MAENKVSLQGAAGTDLAVDASGYLTVNQAGGSAGSVSAHTRPGMTTADGLILAANAARKWAQITNEGPSIAFVKLSTVASSLTSYTAQIAVLEKWVVPTAWTGQIRGITASTTAQLQVSELA